VCDRGIILYIEKRGNDAVGNAAGRSGETFFDNFRILSSAPSVPPVEVVDNLPRQIQQAFSEAEANFADGRLMSSAIMFRKTVELTVRDLNPEGKGMLNARIRALQKAEAVPDTLIKLLDTVKFLGNEGAHDEEAPSIDDVERGRDFTRLFLVYSYELPARIASALPNEKTG